MIRVAANDERYFAQKMMDNSRKDIEKVLIEKRKILKKHSQRIQEIDTLFERLYINNVSGKITDERFGKISANFEQEQAGLKEAVTALEKEIAAQESQVLNVDMFITKAREILELRELTPAIVNTFISRIYVYNPDNARSRKDRTQRIEIVYNFVGPFDVLEMEREKSA